MSRFLRLDAACPKCHKRPAVRIAEAERELALRQPPATIKQSVQCSGCGTVYEITAKSFHGAA